MVRMLSSSRAIGANTLYARMYTLFINGWGDITYFETSSWLLAMDPIITGLVAFLVQLFFAWRLHIVASNRILTLFIVVISFATLCGAIGVAIAVLWVHDLAYFGRAGVRQITCVWLISTVVADFFICGALTYYLLRRRGTYQATGNLLDRIVRRECFMLLDHLRIYSLLPVTVHNGLLTSLLALTALICYLASVRTSCDPTPWPS